MIYKTKEKKMMNTNTTTETRNVTAKELAQRFEGKYVDITPYNSFLVDFMYDMTGVDISETIF